MTYINKDYIKNFDIPDMFFRQIRDATSVVGVLNSAGAEKSIGTSKELPAPAFYSIDKYLEV